MTIIAGFRCHEGVVICADTQETVNELSKRRVTKVRFERCYGSSDLEAAFCGAGDGPLIDTLTREAWNAAKPAGDVDEASAFIENRMKEVYREFGGIYQPGMCPSAELIYGLKMGDDNRLFQAHGPIVNPVEEYCSGGIGYYMADFLSARCRSSFLSLHEMVILAAYILSQAKEHVNGCGGDSHIAILRNDGESGILGFSRVRAITDLLNAVDATLSEILIKSTVLTKNWDTISDMTIENALDAIKAYRGIAQEQIDHAAQWSFLAPKGPDEFGFGGVSLPIDLPEVQPCSDADAAGTSGQEALGPDEN